MTDNTLSTETSAQIAAEVARAAFRSALAAKLPNNEAVTIAAKALEIICNDHLAENAGPRERWARDGILAALDAVQLLLTSHLDHKADVRVRMGERIIHAAKSLQAIDEAARMEEVTP